MQQFCQNWINIVQQPGRMFSFYLIFKTKGWSNSDYEYFTDEEVISVNPHYEGKLVGTLLKVLDIELKTDKDPEYFKGKEISCRIKIALSSADFGSDSDYSTTKTLFFSPYYVYKAERKEETDSLILTCYDAMIDSSITYDLSTTEHPLSFPITVKEYLQAICKRLGWAASFPDSLSDNLAVKVNNEYYLDFANEGGDTATEASAVSSFTFRDVLEQLGQLLGGCLAFLHDISGSAPELTVVYPSFPESDLTLPVSNQQTVKIESVYGPINCVACVDSSLEEYTANKDTASIETYGECRFEIVDNQILIAQTNDFLAGIFSKLNGLTYTPYEFNSFGYGYLDFGDCFYLETKDGSKYHTIMLCDDMKFSRGFTETAFAKALTASNGEYSELTEAEKALNRVKIKIDRLNQIITYIAQDTAGNKTLIEQTPEAILTQISGQYASSEELENVKIALETKINEKAGEITETFTERLKDSTDGSSAKIEEINAYIKRGIDTTDNRPFITLYTSDDDEPVLTLKNNVVYFFEDGVEGTRLTNRTVYSGNGQFEESVAVGRFAWVLRSNGHYSLVKRGY